MVKKYFVLQRIYVSLDEPDGVAGVAAIRQEDPSLDEQVIQHVATGDLRNLSVILKYNRFYFCYFQLGFISRDICNIRNIQMVLENI